MNRIFVYLSLFSFFICVFLGLLVYFRDVRYKYDKKLAKIFVFLCFSLAFFWAIIEFGYRHAINYEIALFWLKLNVFWYFVVALLLHFILLLTENYKLLKKKITYFGDGPMEYLNIPLYIAFQPLGQHFQESFVCILY